MAIKPKRVKVTAKDRKKYRIRKKVSGSSERPRITIFKSSKHTYAQAVSDCEGKTLVSASTRESEVQSRCESADIKDMHSDKRSSKSVLAAQIVGNVLAERCLAKDIKTAKFDRNGYRYAGRVKALADGARKGGLTI